ncbi:MAG: glycosyltransferase family 4 protein [Rhizobiaceae bacterium]
MVKIVHMSSGHEALDHRIFYKEARYTHGNDFEVAVIANHKRVESVSGIKIVPIPKRSRAGRMLLSPWSILRKALREQADIYHFHDPELIPVGLALRAFGKVVIYDIHEIVAQQIALRAWIPPILRKPVSVVFDKFERFAIRRFDGISVPQTYMRDRYQPDARRVALTRNFVSVTEVSEPGPLTRRPHLLYAGTMSVERGLLNMVRAMPYVLDGHRLLLAGQIAPALLAAAQREPGWGSVDYLSRLPFVELPAVYAQASIGLILYENLGQYHLAHAVKLFEFLVHGMPVIMPNFGEWPAFNEEHEVGINVDTSNPRAVGEAVNRLVQDTSLAERLGRNGRRLVVGQFSWEQEVRNLHQLYKDVMAC